MPTNKVDRKPHPALTAAMLAAAVLVVMGVTFTNHSNVGNAFATLKSQKAATHTVSQR